ncbi:SHOCT domain-containing protein [Paenibacillus tuaregi]|uniref:SHOCT domain-containing protein n=1 Tax=Paenibacillus tuaregi TaxID=1816681 RepID=UPI000838DE92|nr:SHOCT domain-containing protein [Paenibacillus tuaregi]
MHPKRIIISGTIAVVVTISTGLHSEKIYASPLVKLISINIDKVRPQLKKSAQASLPASDSLHTALGTSSDEELYQAVYNGQSLAEIAQAKQGNVQQVIDLQLAELEQQLEQRLASGSLTEEQFLAQKAELPAIVESSVYGKKYS